LTWRFKGSSQIKNLKWTAQLCALLPHPSQPAVLGIAAADGLRLPQVILTEQISSSQIDRVQDGLRRVCELPFNVLRCLAFTLNQQESRTDALYLLEAREDGFLTGDLPVGWSWIRLDEMQPEMVPQGLRSKVSNWVAGRLEQITLGTSLKLHSLYPPWARPGWYAQAEAWIIKELARTNLSVRTIEPVKSWSISAVLRVQTLTHPVFFKASLKLPLFVNEGVVMAGLAQLYPNNIPTPLAINVSQGWMLLEDLGEPIGRDAPLEQQVRLFQEMANLQIDSTSRIDSMLQMGCIDRRIPWLTAHMDALAADEITLSQITQEEREALKRALPFLKSLLTELDSLPIPPGLIHGDLHSGNVSDRDGKLQLFDWTDAAISHPFFDLDVVFSADDPTRQKILEDAYLHAWKQLYPAGEVGRAFELARIVYGLYHAVSYQYILNNIEEDDQPEINSAHYFLRQVLHGLAKFNPPLLPTG
jgi:hypothetical protein